MDTLRARGAVTGIVFDSLARAPLANAEVQLVARDDRAAPARNTTTDARGRFTITGVPDDVYVLGFFHPLLDSLALQPPIREVTVHAGREARADLAIPSPARLRVAFCGPTAITDSIGALVGMVRDASGGSPLEAATVTARWIELTIGPGGLTRRVAGLADTTRANGWFAMCGVPMNGSLTLTAGRGDDSSGVLELDIPAEGFARRNLFLSAVRVTVVSDSVAPGDTVPAPRRRIRSGDFSLAGTVLAAAGGRPLVGAIVSLQDGPQARTNENGEWTLANAPGGTQTLDVRAVGFYPERRMVDVVAGAPRIRVTLSTLKAVLDTVRVTATRMYNRRLAGFEQRRRTLGFGRFLTEADIARRPAVEVTDLLRNLPGVRVYRQGFDKVLLVRGGVEDWCVPSVWVDDHYVFNMSGDDVDNWVKPDRVAGIEVYVGISTPAQYQRGLSGCGAIVIWTK